MTRIPILHLVNVVGDSSIGSIVQRLVAHLGRRDYSWHVGGLGGLWGSLPKELVDLGARVVDFSDRQNGSKCLTRNIREYVSSREVQIVHSHTPRSRLAAAISLIAAPRTTHVATEHLLYAPRDRRWGLVYALLDRSTLCLPDHIVAVSQTMRRQLTGLPCLRAGRITAVANAIDSASYFTPEERIPCRSEFGLTPEAAVIAYAGRIDRVKRLDLLFEGFVGVLAQHPQARLTVIGQGEQEPKLKALAIALGISDAVIWTGFRQDIPRMLAATDIYVQPSDNEGLSLSILEAMAAGKPVIATDVGGVREVLTHEETGILIPPGSASAIGSAIIDLLDHPEKRTALGQAARDQVVQDFGVHKMVEGYGHVYESLVSRL